jgi:hypothetical protein
MHTTVTEVVGVFCAFVRRFTVAVWFDHGRCGARRRVVTGAAAVRAAAAPDAVGTASYTKGRNAVIRTSRFSLNWCAGRCPCAVWRYPLC